jgi:hypothetical protein
MAEPYSDEELAAWLAVYPPKISSLDVRWRPTIERLLAERNDAQWVARRAGELVRKHVSRESLSSDERGVLISALAYPEFPEVPHG